MEQRPIGQLSCCLDMRPNISEFSYGFAMTSELVKALGIVTAAPVFPSLRSEGDRGGGWDVKLDRPGVPLFLQFKLCDQMIRSSCREARDASFDLPCYRMHLRSARLSRQHEMLLDLEGHGQEVYYSAPMFHQPEELNDAFLDGSVRERSIWIRPSDIGQLPDDRDHHVSFEPGSPWTLFSEPRPINAKRKFEDVAVHLTNRLQEHGRIDISQERLGDLADAIAKIADKRLDISKQKRDISKKAAQTAAPLQRVAYYASVFLESQLFVVQKRSEA